MCAWWSWAQVLMSEGVAQTPPSKTVTQLLAPSGASDSGSARTWMGQPGCMGSVWKVWGSGQAFIYSPAAACGHHVCLIIVRLVQGNKWQASPCECPDSGPAAR